MQHVIIKCESIIIRAKVMDTPTAHLICQNLPLDSVVQTWGEEVYFSVPVQAEVEDDAKDVVSAGEIAYWPDGPAIAIGFGPTPISIQEEIRLASRCNIWAQAVDDVRLLKGVEAGCQIQVENV